jgi:hypothetical protein
MFGQFSTGRSKIDGEITALYKTHEISNQRIGSPCFLSLLMAGAREGLA